MTETAKFSSAQDRPAVDPILAFRPRDAGMKERFSLRIKFARPPQVLEEISRMAGYARVIDLSDTAGEKSLLAAILVEKR